MRSKQLWLIVGCTLVTACGTVEGDPGEAEDTSEVTFDDGSLDSLSAPAGCTALFNAPAVSVTTKTMGADQGGIWNLWSNGYIEQSVSFPAAATYKIIVEAQAPVVRNVGAQMEVRIDQTRVGVVEVRASSWTAYEFSVNVSAGAHKVAIAFMNDAAYSATEDRNLLLKTVLVSPTNCGGSTSGNLALNKPINASSIEGAFTPAKAVDGTTATRWSSAFSDPQWIYVDLGASYTISRVKLTWEVAYGKGYQVQVSANASTWSTVYSTNNGDGGVDDLINLSATGRYVRVNGTARGTQWGYSLWELEVYGQGATSCTPTTCAARSRTCGTISDGCGGTLTCGAPCSSGGVAEPAPMTWTQIREDNGTLASRPYDPSRRVHHGDTGVYPVLNFGFSWYFGGESYLGDPMRIPSNRWSAMTVWHIIYPEAQSPGGAAKSTVTNKNIIFRRYHSWVHLKSGGWVKTQGGPPDHLVTWQADAEQSNSLRGDAQNRIINDPSTGEPLYYENGPAPGWMNHGWLNARGTFANGAIDGAYSTFDVRCDQPGANLLVASGIDWWESNTAPWPNNTGYSQSSWIRVTTDWKTITGTSLSEELLRRDPPPPLVGIGE